MQLAEGLRARGHQVAFLATAHPLNTEETGEFVPLTVTNASRDHLSGRAAIGVALRAVWNPDAASAMRALIRRLKPDLVHGHKLYVQLSVAPVVVAASHGVPVVQTVHDYEFTAADSTDASGGWIDRGQPRPEYRLLNTLIYGVKRHVHRPRVAAWIAVSRSTAAIYSAAGIDTTVIPNFTKAPPSSAPVAGFRERHGVLFVGRLSREKGVTHLLELASHAPELPIAIGGQGPLDQLVLSAAKTSPNVEYLGALRPSEVTARLRSARLVVMPSLWQEPAGLAALEAMAQGTPVIAYNTGGLAEYLTDSGAGVVIPPLTTALVGAVRELYTDPRQWAAVAKRGPEAISTTHDLQRYLDRLELVYARAAGRAI
jgi:glycosyltransferase involved in cell wall biosynthesis